MVSIHIVPVILYLIIRVIYFAFRFKCEALHCRSLHVLRLVGNALQVETSNAEPHACMYNNSSNAGICRWCMVHQRLYKCFDNIASKWSRCSRIFHFHLLTLYLIVLPLLWYVYFLHIRKKFVILQRNRERVIPSPYLLLYNKVFQE